MKTALRAAVLFLLSAGLPVMAQESLLKQATFCHGLEENHSPKEKAESFAPDQTIYFSVELKGRPKSGIVSAKFMIEKSLIAEAKVDLATVNKGVLFSVGQSTFAGFNLTHEKPLPIGDMYTAEVNLDGKPMGVFPFRVAPPKEAIESKFKSAKFEKEVDGERQILEPEASLAPEDNVVLKGVADLGLGTWIRGSWFVNGQLAPKSARTVTLEENKAECGFSFSFRPDEGWPKGRHEVSLLMNGKEVARPSFTVKETLPHRMTPEVGQVEPASFSLLKTDAKGENSIAVAAFGPKDFVLQAEWKLKRPAKGAGVKFIWMLVDADGEKNIPIAEVPLGDGTYRKLLTTLNAPKGLPVGKFRVDLTLEGKVLDSQPFEVR